MKKVSMYALSTCPWCRKTKQFFTERNIPFSYTDYDLADEATQARISQELDAAGATGFPFVRIGDETVMGYQPERYSRALGIYGGVNEYWIKEECAAIFLQKCRRPAGFQVHARRGAGGVSARTGGDSGRQARHPFLPLPAVAARSRARHEDCLPMHSLSPDAFRRYETMLVRTLRPPGCRRPGQPASTVAT